MTSVINAINLRKEFDELVAVASINFSIEEGECFGFLGPNGAGKSTTMRMIYCVSPLTSGTLNVLGMDVKEDHQREIKALIGMIAQEKQSRPGLHRTQEPNRVRPLLQDRTEVGIETC